MVPPVTLRGVPGRVELEGVHRPHRELGARPREGVRRHRRTHLHALERAALTASPEHAVDPPGPGGGARRGAFHLLHRLEVGAVRLRLAHRVDEPERPGVVEGLEGSHRRVHPEHRVELEQGVRRDADVGPPVEVVGVARRHDRLEPVEAPPQRQHHEHVARVRAVGERVARRVGLGGDRERAGRRGGLEERSTRDPGVLRASARVRRLPPIERGGGVHRPSPYRVW